LLLDRQTHAIRVQPLRPQHARLRRKCGRAMSRNPLAAYRLRLSLTVR